MPSKKFRNNKLGRWSLILSNNTSGSLPRISIDPNTSCNILEENSSHAISYLLNMCIVSWCH